MRLHFSIRDLLWLTVVAALAVGWWLDYRQVARERDGLKAQNNMLENKLLFAEERKDSYHGAFTELLRFTRNYAKKPGNAELDRWIDAFLKDWRDD
ncbi:MAG TPA: hypothetical protein VGJ15_01560 [Pirellulales bacterium]|jgi:hypothetical protein